MGVRSGERRAKKWNAKLQGEALSKVVERQKDLMFEQVQVVFPLLEDLENRVKHILQEAGTDLIDNVSYLNFGREVFAAKRRHAGPQLITITDALLQKYVACGLDRDVLERIRNEVFTIEAPTP